MSFELDGFEYKSLEEMKKDYSEGLTPKQNALFGILTRNVQMFCSATPSEIQRIQDTIEKQLLEDRELAIFTVENLEG